jgi:hypothetical protein
LEPAVSLPCSQDPATSPYPEPHQTSPCKSKGIPRQAEVALGVQGRLRPRIFSTFGTTRVVGRQPNAPATFTPGEVPGTHFQRLSRRQGTWFCRKELRKKSQVTPPGIDPGTVRLVAQRLNHYATPGPNQFMTPFYLWKMHFNIMLPSATRSFEWSPLGSPTKVVQYLRF